MRVTTQCSVIASQKYLRTLKKGAEAPSQTLDLQGLTSGTEHSQRVAETESVPLSRLVACVASIEITIH